MPDLTAPGVYAYESTVTLTFKVTTEPGSPASEKTESEDLAALNDAIRGIVEESILGLVTDGLVVEVTSKREEV